MVRSVFVLLFLSFLSACNSLAPTPPTATPTREYSAPTLAPSPFFRFEPPTEIPPNTMYIGQNNPEAARIPANSDLPPLVVNPDESSIGVQTVQVSTRQDVIIRGELYQNAPVQIEAEMVTPHLPGVLVIGSSPQGWGTFPSALRDAGFTVLVIDTFETMTSQDVSSILGAFSETSSVNPGLIAIVGAQEGADLGLIACAVNLLCDAAALLSPISDVTLTNIMPNYNPRPLFVAASTEDIAGFNTMQQLQAAATGDFTLQPYNSAGRGVEMLASQPGLSGIIIQWLQTHLAG